MASTELWEGKETGWKNKLKVNLVQDQLYVKWGSHYSIIEHSLFPDRSFPEITVS